MNTVLLFASFFLRDPAVIITFVVATMVIALALRRGHRRRNPKQLLATLATSAALALIVAFTWLPGGGDYAALNPTRWSPRRIIDSAMSLPAGFGTWAHGTDGTLNVLLYVPAGLAITALVPRLPETWRVPAALIALSLATEVWQALNGSRTGQPATSSPTASARSSAPPQPSQSGCCSRFAPGL